MVRRMVEKLIVTKTRLDNLIKFADATTPLNSIVTDRIIGLEYKARQKLWKSMLTVASSSFKFSARYL